MKFGTRILDDREQAIVRGADGAVRALADVTEAAGLGRIDDMLSLVRACDEQPELLSRLDPNDLHVTGRLNDDVFTQDHTGNYRFSIQRCIAEASQHFTLRPGDLLSFGTTGKGNDKFPRGHKSVLIGQQQGSISIEIDPLGRLENPIRHQKGGA